MNRLLGLFLLAGIAGAQPLAPARFVGAGEIRIPDETQPPGGTVQFKVMLTEPKPISSGTKLVGIDAALVDGINGIALSSPLGDAFGVARFANGVLTVRSFSPLASLGTDSDYPLVTIAAHVRADAVPGASAPVPLGAGSFWRNFLGQSFPLEAPKLGRLTIGGALSIHNVIPGGGTWPAGTVIRVTGSGFQPATTVRTKFKVQSASVVSDAEIDLVLARPTQMDSQRITLTNPDGSTVIYYSYLRGVDAGVSAEPAVAAIEAVFPLRSWMRGVTFQRPAGPANSVLTAMAMQNPNAGPVTVDLEAWSPLTGVLARASVPLASGQKISRELGEYFGRKLAAGVVVRAKSDAPVQFVGFTVDKSTGDFSPHLVFP